MKTIIALIILGLSLRATDANDWLTSMTDGVHQYKQVDGKWVINKEADKSIADETKHKRGLMIALQSRILTDAEMVEVGKYGRSLNIYPGVVYFEKDKQQELNEALLQQFRLRSCKN